MEIEEAYEKMKVAPQTYNTIIGEIAGSPTERRILRRKLNRDFKEGHVMKTLVPNSAFSKVMFYPNDKKYTIFFVERIFGCDVYYCNKYKEKGTRVIVPKCYVLKGTQWHDLKEKTIHKEDIIKVL